jgi:hypothetical protein
MKAISLLFIMLVSGFISSAQNEKCLAFSTDVIKDIKSKILSQGVDFNDVYFVKAEIPSIYDLEALKTVCDTSAKATKVSFNWRLNYDKNTEKEYVINGKKILITIYFNDKFMYFEFPKQ